jgi:hypothetical protein
MSNEHSAASVPRGKAADNALVGLLTSENRGRLAFSSLEEMNVTIHRSCDNGTNQPIA